MDHEFVRGSVKSVIACWTRPGTTSLKSKQQNVKSDHGVWGSQKTHFKVYIIHWHDPTGFVVIEAKELVW